MKKHKDKNKPFFDTPSWMTYNPDMLDRTRPLPQPNMGLLFLTCSGC